MGQFANHFGEARNGYIFKFQFINTSLQIIYFQAFSFQFHRVRGIEASLNPAGNQFL